jgi:hypothetical protein
MRQVGVKRIPESGFALLFIYAMAATVAITLLMELPRVAFEAQRDKEQLLIDRGEQYSRAVNLYVRKFNKYPADFDALQNTQNLRFLRHKYLDPMTGKDDWRIIHVGPGGVFTDSLVYGKKKDDKQQAEQQNFIGEMQQTGGNQVDTTQTVNIGTRQRQSDQPGAPGDPNNPNQTPPPQFDANGQPILNANGAVPGQPGVPGQFQPGANGAPGGFPNGLPPGFQNAPGQPFPGQAPFPGQPYPGAPGQVGGMPGQQPGQPGFPQTGGPPTSAGNLINQLLTTPRPGGLNGLGGVQQGAVDPNGNPIQNTNGFGPAAGSPLSSPSSPAGTATPTAAAGQTIGGGIAGVATKREQEGIKIYKDQKSYHKWEFVYDITKDPARTGGTVPQAAPPPGTPIGGGTPGAQLGGQPGALLGTPGANGMPLPTGNPSPTPPQTPVTPQ